MQAATRENRLPAQAHDGGENHDDYGAAQEHDLSHAEHLGDVFYDGVIGGNHRHRDDHENGGLEVVEFHARRLTGWVKNFTLPAVKERLFTGCRHHRYQIPQRLAYLR